MRKIELVTFKGYQSTVDCHAEIEEMIDSENLDAEAEMVVVPSPEKAEEMGLYGSPTILIDGVEIQQERRGPAGMY
ncbi:MAG: hypothetical protein ACUZ8E_10490 [Candidatus Anammoxibacter sp.]